MAYGNSSRGGRAASGRPQNSRGGRPGAARPGQGGKPGAKGASARGGRPGAPKSGAGKGGAKGFGEKKFGDKKFGEKKFGAGRAGSGRGRGTELPKRERRAPGRPYRSGEAFANERGEYRVCNYAGPHRPRRPRNPCLYIPPAALIPYLGPAPPRVVLYNSIAKRGHSDITLQ